MRADRTSAELREVASELLTVVEAINQVAEDMEAAKMPTILVHGDAAMNRYVPSLQKWAATLLIDRTSQLRAFKKGVESKAQWEKNRATTKKKPAGK